MRKKKLRNTRPKALFGEVAAAGITAAATLAAAGIGAAATAKAAKEQSAATIENAKQQAASIEATNVNNNQLQQQSQQFIAQQNEANRQIQRDFQMNLQLQSGALDTEQRRMASRIQVKKGGKVKSRKKLRDAQFPLQGGNLPFQVLDGGGVLPLGQTPEGYDLYEIIGNDHRHYHKTRGGKYKSGVGIKFGDGQVVEGEGNQGGNQGEYLMVTPDSGMFISKHSINGFNPVQAINNGMNPSEAYAIQEVSKGISPVERNRYKAVAGVSTNYILPSDYPMSDLGFDMTGINVAAVRRQLKKGGRCKAPFGLSTHFNFTRNNPFYKVMPGLTVSASNPPYAYSPNNSNSLWSRYKGNLSYLGPNNNDKWYSGLSGNLIGAGITSLGNIGGAALNTIFTNRGAKIASAAELERGRILGNAYRNLKGVDMSIIDDKTYDYGSIMPVLQSTKFYDNTQREGVARQARTESEAANNMSLSSAARLARTVGINARANEMLSTIAENTANKEAENRRINMAASNEAATKSAELRMQSNRDKTAARLELAKYNNEIANQRILGPAEAEAEARANAAGILAGAATNAGQSWGSAIAGTGQAFGNAFATDASQRMNIEMARLSASRNGELSYLRRFGSSNEINREVARLNAIINNPNTTPDFKEQAIRDKNYLLGTWS